MSNSIFVDNNSTTRIDKKVVEAMAPYYDTFYGNPSSDHEMGRIVSNAIKQCKDYLSKTIGCQSEELYFTGGGTESNNIAITGYVMANRSRGNHIISSPIEHPSVKGIFHKYLKNMGFDISFIKPDKNGVVDPGKIGSAIKDSTILVSIMHANNVTGAVQPVQAIGELCGEKNIVFHTDAVQSFGKIPINVQKMHLSMLSASSHKIYGPKGSGLLYLKKGTKITPPFYGGHQQMGIRAGTENVPGIIGFTEAFKLCNSLHNEENMKIRNIRDNFEALVLKEIRDCIVISADAPRVSGTSTLCFKNMLSIDVLRFLNDEGVYASPGSACATGKMYQGISSPVLKAMDVDPEYIKGCVRFSFGRFNRFEELEIILRSLKNAVDKCKTMSKKI